MLRIRRTYQPEQAIGHYADHVNEHGDFEFPVATTSWLLISGINKLKLILLTLY